MFDQSVFVGPYTNSDACNEMIQRRHAGINNAS